MPSARAARPSTTSPPPLPPPPGARTPPALPLELPAGHGVVDPMHPLLGAPPNAVEVVFGAGRGRGHVVEDPEALGGWVLQLVAGIVIGLGLPPRTGLRCRRRSCDEGREDDRAGRLHVSSQIA